MTPSNSDALLFDRRTYESMEAAGRVPTTRSRGDAGPGLDPELTNYPYPFETQVFPIESQRERLRMVFMDERPKEWNERTVLLPHGTGLGRGWSPPEVAPTMGDYTQLGKRTARASPGSKLVELEGLGHMPQAENFNAYFTPLLDFIASP